MVSFNGKVILNCGFMVISLPIRVPYSRKTERLIDGRLSGHKRKATRLAKNKTVSRNLLALRSSPPGEYDEILAF